MFSTAAALNTFGPDTASTSVGSAPLAPKVKVNFTTPPMRAWHASGGCFGMLADTKTGSPCAAVVIEIKAAKKRMIEKRIVIGLPFGRGLYPGFADLQRVVARLVISLAALTQRINAIAYTQTRCST